MKTAEVRTRFLEFFKARGHTIVSSASLIPENDPTTLFTGSGMQPLLPYLLGAKHPAGNRLVNSQKCFRAEDMKDVGDNRHTTFFEMLGNWSLGDYWKEDELPWFFEFLTKELGLKKERLWVTYFKGDATFNLPPDHDSAAIWKKIGIPDKHIFPYGAEKNWWSRSGSPDDMPVGEPGGPDSEIFYEFESVTHDKKFGERCHPNCDCGRFMEIGNSVFMEYRKLSGVAFGKLSQRNVDFGGGLERLAVATRGEPDIFAVDAFADIVQTLEGFSRVPYEAGEKERSFRIVADHFRAAVFLIADGAMPSNTDQGYFVRRLLRRTIRHLDLLGVSLAPLAPLVDVLVSRDEDTYPELAARRPAVVEAIAGEEKRFRKTLAAGMREFEKIRGDTISGKEAFTLFATYGIPIDLTVEMAQERGKGVDSAAFERERRVHQEISRVGAEKKFKGGLVDTSDRSVKYHTATHLLNRALRDVLGPHVKQMGSNITPDRLRFDFTHGVRLTSDERRVLEDTVNKKIKEGLPVHAITLPVEEAKRSGALHFFGEKYQDMVTVYYIGKDLATAYSKEFCGGPHVKNTRELNGRFKIIKEESVAAGVRRIKAVLEPEG